MPRSTSNNPQRSSRHGNSLFVCESRAIYITDEHTMKMMSIAFRNLTEAVVKDLCKNKTKSGECMCRNIAKCNREVIIMDKASLVPCCAQGVLKQEHKEFYAGLLIEARNKVIGFLCVLYNHFCLSLL